MPGSYSKKIINSSFHRHTISYQLAEGGINCVYSHSLEWQGSLSVGLKLKYKQTFVCKN